MYREVSRSMEVEPDAPSKHPEQLVVVLKGPVRSRS
jgi:hypothetical protein